MSAEEARPLLDIGLTCGRCGGILPVYREVCTDEPPCIIGCFRKAGPHECAGPIVDATELTRSA